VAQSGTIYITEDYWQILREATGASLANTVVTTNGTNTVIFVAPPGISPNYGYFPMGEFITVTSRYSTVYFTTDGTDPTTNSSVAQIVGGIGTIHWQNSSNDLQDLRIKAFNGTNSSVTISGLPPPVNELGLSRDVVGGPGSLLYLPVSISLRPNTEIRSFQFRIEFVPLNGAPPFVDPILATGITPNDFVPLPAIAPKGVDAFYSALPYQNGVTNGFLVSAIGTNSNFDIKDSSVLSFFTVPVPPTAPAGATYSVSVYNVSATVDGFQGNVLVTNSAPRVITVASPEYIVGDTAPGGWYNAGDFGDGILLNNDVNNAFNTSLGLYTMAPGSDVFDSMDAYPEDVPPAAGGDGQIRFLDWQVILFRSLGLENYNFARSWDATGERTSRLIASPSPRSIHSARGPLPSPKLTNAVPPGQVWLRQAAFGSSPPPVVQPGAYCAVPIYVAVRPAYTLGGLQFRAAVRPDQGGPAVTTAQFLPATSVRPFAISTGLGANEVALGWPLGSFLPALAGSNFLGYLNFSIPTNAISGQTYSIHFTNEDGAPNLQTEFNLEGLSSVLGVSVPSSTPGSITSDDWKIHFFGDVSNPNAADNADPDGDGSPNWMEYLAGTDPTNSLSRLAFQLPGSPGGPSNPAPLSWLSAPGKNYVVETSSTIAPAHWFAITGTIPGDGYEKSFQPPAPGAGSQFYRLRLQP
jgi:hypothetical protein